MAHLLAAGTTEGFPQWLLVALAVGGTIIGVITPLLVILWQRWVTRYDEIARRATAAVDKATLDANITKADSALRQLVKDVVEEVRRDTRTDTQASLAALGGQLYGLTEYMKQAKEERKEQLSIVREVKSELDKVAILVAKHDVQIEQLVKDGF